MHGTVIEELDVSWKKQLDFLWGAAGLYIYLFWSHDFSVGNANGNANGNTNGNTNGYCRALQTVTLQAELRDTGDEVPASLFSIPKSVTFCCLMRRIASIQI